MWVQAIYQGDFFVSALGFPLSFASDGVANVAERFEVYEFGGVVAAGKSWGVLGLVFCYSTLKMIRYSNV